jgi:hypothetical protein
MKNIITKIENMTALLSNNSNIKIVASLFMNITTRSSSKDADDDAPNGPGLNAYFSNVAIIDSIFDNLKGGHLGGAINF